MPHVRGMEDTRRTATVATGRVDYSSASSCGGQCPSAAGACGPEKRTAVPGRSREKQERLASAAKAEATCVGHWANAPRRGPPARSQGGALTPLGSLSSRGTGHASFRPRPRRCACARTRVPDRARWGRAACQARARSPGSLKKTTTKNKRWNLLRVDTRARL